MRRAVLLALSVLAGAAVAGESARKAWSCNQDLAESVDALVGPDAIDCGFHEMFKSLRKAVHRKAYGCVEQALRGDKPFRFGTRRIPLDSVVTEILVRSRDGKLWLIVHDYIFGEEQATQ